MSSSSIRAAAFADLFQSRLRSILPLGFMSFVGLSIFIFFSSINPKLEDSTFQLAQNSQYPSFGGDRLGWLIPSSFPQSPNDIVETQKNSDLLEDIDKLMSLPILHRTFKDPFDPRSGFKPVPDSKAPWSATTPAAVQLNNRLSINRFPHPEVDDALSGSSPPPPLEWPPRYLIQEKTKQLKYPIPEHLIHGLNTSYVWKDRPFIEKEKLPKIQWSGFHQPEWESQSDRTIRIERQGWVRRGFQHVWEGYKSKAWAHDELKPISGSFQDPFGGWGATVVDCLDTLLIMNLTREYNYARTHIRAIDWAHTIQAKSPGAYGSELLTQSPISIFETVIRYLGGLISAYDLSGDGLMLERAEELAQWLLPAFGTSSGLPQSGYQIGSNPSGQVSGRICLAEVGSLTLEFTRLAQLTSKEFYYDVVQKITDLLDKTDWSTTDRLGTLFPHHFDPSYPQSLYGEYTFGSMADSYYEYLIKEYQLLGGTNSQYSRMFVSAIESARVHLIRNYELEPSGGKNITVIGDVSWGIYSPSLDHLVCFSGAMIGLSAKLLDRKQDLDLALEHTDACAWMYESTKTGIGPERASILEGDDDTRWQKVTHQGKNFRELKPVPLPGVTIQDGRYFGRPETIESVYYMWRITGDRQWQDRGWRMFTSWMEACTTLFGFADLNHVNALPPDLSDKQESFVLGETFKYYYLLFSEPNLISLDDFVMNTEAHPLRIETKGKDFKTYWTGPDKAIDEMYDPPWIKEGEVGFGTYLQQWSRVNPDELSDANLQIYNQVLGFKT